MEASFREERRTMRPILRFEQVSKNYPNGVHALKNVSFEVREGEFISIIGPSGSGKSTVLRLINHLIPITSGKIWLDGEEVSRERTAAWRDSLLERGYAPATVNSMIAAANQFFDFLGWEAKP